MKRTLHTAVKGCIMIILHTEACNVGGGDNQTTAPRGVRTRKFLVDVPTMERTRDRAVADPWERNRAVTKCKS